MKKILSLSVLVLAVLTGCSQKSPEVDMTSNSTMSNGSGIDNSLSGSNMSGSSDLGNLGGVKSVYFDFDKFNIRQDQQGVVSQNAGVLNKFGAIKVEGNCDEFGTDEYNYALGLKRAKAVKDGLIAKGVSSSKISIVSYGESNPVCKESNKSCWNKNRRVDFK